MTPTEVPDIGRTAERHYADQGTCGLLGAPFRRGPVRHDGILSAMTKAIQKDFTYNPRDEMGTQDPVDHPETGTGTCRDYALLMMEAARTLGFAARFVSGYLYDDSKLAAAEIR